MKKFTVTLTAIFLAVLCCFAVVGCNNSNNSSNEGCYLDEQSDAFAGGYTITVTDFDVADKVSIGGNDYSSDYEDGKFVVVTATMHRNSEAEDATITRNWFTLKVGDTSVTISDSMFEDFTINTNSYKSVTLRFDVESADGEMQLVVAQPEAEDSVTVTLAARK